MNTSQQRPHRKVLARLRMARDRIARADYGSAIALLRSALRQMEKDPASSFDRALCYIELARCYNRQGDYTTASAYAQWAKNLLRDEWDAKLALAEANLELGISFTRTGDLQRAQRCLASAYETFTTHNLWVKAGECMENIALLAKQQEHLVRAINALAFAKRFYQQVEDITGVLRVNSQLRELIRKE